MLLELFSKSYIAESVRTLLQRVSNLTGQEYKWNDHMSIENNLRNVLTLLTNYMDDKGYEFRNTLDHHKQKLFPEKDSSFRLETEGNQFAPFELSLEHFKLFMSDPKNLVIFKADHHLFKCLVELYAYYHNNNIVLDVIEVRRKEFVEHYGLAHKKAVAKLTVSLEREPTFEEIQAEVSRTLIEPFHVHKSEYQVSPQDDNLIQQMTMFLSGLSAWTDLTCGQLGLSDNATLGEVFSTYRDVLAGFQIYINISVNDYGVSDAKNPFPLKDMPLQSILNPVYSLALALHEYEHLKRLEKSKPPEKATERFKWLPIVGPLLDALIGYGYKHFQKASEGLFTMWLSPEKQAGNILRVKGAVQASCKTIARTDRTATIEAMCEGLTSDLTKLKAQYDAERGVKGWVKEAAFGNDFPRVIESADRWLRNMIETTAYFRRVGFGEIGLIPSRFFDLRQAPEESTLKVLIEESRARIEAETQQRLTAEEAARLEAEAAAQKEARKAEPRGISADGADEELGVLPTSAAALTPLRDVHAPQGQATGTSASERASSEEEEEDVVEEEAAEAPADGEEAAQAKKKKKKKKKKAANPT